MREDVHAGGVEPHEEWSIRLHRPVDKVESTVQEFLVDGLHALGVESTGILDFLCAVGLGPAVEYAARAELLLELRVLGIVGTFRLLLGVQVVEVAEELVEAVRGGKKLVAIAEMVLAELPGGVAEGLQQFGDGWIFRLQSQVCARQ